jgi:hypothetical protein
MRGFTAWEFRVMIRANGELFLAAGLEVEVKGLASQARV